MFENVSFRKILKEDIETSNIQINMKTNKDRQQFIVMEESIRCVIVKPNWLVIKQLHTALINQWKCCLVNIVIWTKPSQALTSKNQESQTKSWHQNEAKEKQNQISQTQKPQNQALPFLLAQTSCLVRESPGLGSHLCRTIGRK